MSEHQLIVTSGQGPIEARRFVGQLTSRMSNVCAARGLEVLNVHFQGPPTAPSSSKLILSHPGAERLADEVGTHALIARGDQRGRKARKRWYAGVVALSPVLAEAQFEPKDVEIRFCRSGGPGGQHVNKTSSAVVALHRPTGIRVRADEERSQAQNRRAALRRIADQLATERTARAQAQKDAARLSHYQLTRGNPVRVYHLNERNELMTIQPR